MEGVKNKNNLTPSGSIISRWKVFNPRVAWGRSNSHTLWHLMKMLMISSLEYIFTSSLNKMHLSSNQFHKLFFFFFPSPFFRVPLQGKLRNYCLYPKSSWNVQLPTGVGRKNLCMEATIPFVSDLHRKKWRQRIQTFPQWTRENFGRRSRLVKITIEPTELPLDLQVLKTSPTTVLFLVSSSL